MRFLDSLKTLFEYFSSDPTKHWAQPVSSKRVLDVTTGTFSGIGFGDSYERLQVFGRPENPKPVFYQTFSYFDQGLVFEIEEKKLVSMGLVFQDPYEPRFHGPEFLLVLGPKKEIVLSRETRKSEIEQFLGAPQTSDTDEDEIILTYTILPHTLEFEIGLDERVRRITLYSKDFFR